MEKTDKEKKTAQCSICLDIYEAAPRKYLCDRCSAETPSETLVRVSERLSVLLRSKAMLEEKIRETMWKKVGRG